MIVSSLLGSVEVEIVQGAIRHAGLHQNGGKPATATCEKSRWR